jgi:hypothetical protein
MMALLCGFGNKTEIAIDTEQNILYQCCSADTLLNDFAVDEDKAADCYDDSYLDILGKVSEKAKNNKSFRLSAINTSQSITIKCSVDDKSFIDEIAKLNDGDSVEVYGKLSVSLTGNLEMSIDKLVAVKGDSISDTKYVMRDGYEIENYDMDTRTLSKGRISFLIPSSWKAVEHELPSENLGCMEGYQYCLNEIVDTDDAEVNPESFFVCYFDNGTYLKTTSERNQTTRIERTILANILKTDAGDLGKVPSKTVNTYYGHTYHYYEDIYVDAKAQSHRIEFAFEPVGTDGFVVYVYVYQDSNHMNHIRDIYSVMRFLEVAEK